MPSPPSDHPSRIWGWFLLLPLVLLVRPAVHGDGVFYFGYARSLVFDGDLDVRDEAETIDTPTGNQRTWARLMPDSPTGHLPAIWPVGASLLRLPFYLAAHALVLTLRGMGWNVAADGYSLPYVYGFGVGSAFYALLGFLLTYRIAVRYVAPRTALLALALAWLGTSAVAYTHLHPSLSHACDLFAVSVFLSLVFTTRSSPRTAAWLVWGLAGGLLITVRPQNLVFMILPAMDLWMIEWSRPGGNVGRRLLRTLARGTLFALGLLIGFIPQMLAWRVIFGRWLIHAYAVDPANSFDFRCLAFLRVLFSPLHGLFTWTPVVLLAVLGLGWLARKDRGLAIRLSLAFLLQVYVVGSWSQWWAGASFGNRFFVGSTPIFTLGLGALIEEAGHYLRRPLLWGLAGGLILWNLLFMAQYGLGLLPYEEPVSLAAVARNQWIVLGVIPPLLVRSLGAQGVFLALCAAGLIGWLVFRLQREPYWSSRTISS